MKTSDFDYVLPPELIAQSPVTPRDSSRLMVLYRNQNRLEHAHFRDLPRFLVPGDLLILNQTRVIPARLYARKIPSGGRVEILLLRKISPLLWEAMVGGKGMKAGRRVRIEPVAGEILLEGVVEEVLERGRRVILFSAPLEPLLPQVGHLPLPPYIHLPVADPDRYQTVYARQSGSVAAPTAGLHFSPELMQELRDSGVRFATVTLHIGLDTFAPVRTGDPQKHPIHTEWCNVPPETAELVNQTHAAGHRVFCVGTTSVRSLESAARQSEHQGRIVPFEGPTDLYILPGYQFNIVDAMVTNFHLPKTTLLMMVSAFAGRERILSAYEEAVREKYRFYSFGDAMLIL